MKLKIICLIIILILTSAAMVGCTSDDDPGDTKDKNGNGDGGDKEENLSPKAVIEPDRYRIGVNETAYFSASESYDLDGEIVTYEWDFKDGTNGTGMDVEHSFNETATYAVKLKVTDDDGAFAFAYCMVSVVENMTEPEDNTPTANLTCQISDGVLGPVYNVVVQSSFGYDLNLSAMYFQIIDTGSNRTVYGDTVNAVYGKYDGNVTFIDAPSVSELTQGDTFRIKENEVVGFPESAIFRLLYVPTGGTIAECTLV